MFLERAKFAETSCISDDFQSDVEVTKTVNFGKLPGFREILQESPPKRQKQLGNTRFVVQFGVTAGANTLTCPAQTGGNLGASGS